MPRVVIDARSAVPRGGGIGTYVRDLVTHMLPIAHDFEFLLLRQPHHGEPLVRHERVREAHYRGETKSVRTLFGIRPRNGFADYDLYHAPAEIVPLGLCCASVVTIHDLMWLEAPRLASAFFPVRAANALWYRFNTTRAIHGARRLIAISQATADAISRRFPGHAEKTEVVRHGVDRQRYSRARALPRSALNDIVPAHLRYSLIVGQGSPYKNHPAMVRAFIEATRDAPDHVLVMVRRFSRIDREMARLLARSEIRKKTIVVPFVSDEVLLALMCHARALLFASLYEGFGLPALEVMALGVPVLGSTAAAVAEVVGDAALSAIPTDHDDLVAKIRTLDGDEVLRARLVEAGLRRAAEFSWPRAAEQTLEVYRNALRFARPIASSLGASQRAPRAVENE